MTQIPERKNLEQITRWIKKSSGGLTFVLLFKGEFERVAFVTRSFLIREGHQPIREGRLPIRPGQSPIREGHLPIRPGQSPIREGCGVIREPGKSIREGENAIRPPQNPIRFQKNCYPGG